MSESLSLVFVFGKKGGGDGKGRPDEKECGKGDRNTVLVGSEGGEGRLDSLGRYG